MQYINYYQSPLGKILLAADEIGLIGLWFLGQKYYAANLSQNCEEKSLPVFEQTKDWLNLYFSGQKPEYTPTIHMLGSAFRIEVWKLLLQIPYGETVTYSELAKMVAKHRNSDYMSARAVGGAVAHNNISIIIPCHRVIGANGSLTGYAGGIERKIKLLKLENIDMKNFSVPAITNT